MVKKVTLFVVFLFFQYFFKIYEVLNVQMYFDDRLFYMYIMSPLINECVGKKFS